jgi:hypothetical protein
MEPKGNAWGLLVTATLLLLLAVKALSHGKLQHWLVPDFGVSGSAATFVGLLFLALAAVTLIGWFRKSR